MLMFDRKSAQSHPRKWLPESCPMLASKGNCVVSGKLPGQLSLNLDTICPAGWRKADFGGVVGKGPQKVLKIRTKLTKRVANQGSESRALIMVVRVVFIKLAFGSP